MSFSSQLNRYLYPISVFLLACGSLQGSYSLPVPVGGPIALNPATTFPDPILADLVPVMDNHYQPPYYPGNFFSNTYLSDIYYISNAFTGANVAFNPFNDKIVHLAIGQNQIIDLKGVFFQTLNTNTFATSYDGGATWSYGPPIEQIIPLGGTVSQIINSSIGPGLYFEYTKEGTLHASGWGSFDMVANPPNLDPLTSFLFTTSYDDGLTWEPLISFWKNTANVWFGNSFFNGGPRGTEAILWEFYATVDPSNSDLIHCCTSVLLKYPITDSPSTRFNMAELWYFRSEDGGKTFSTPVNVVTLGDNKEWIAEFFDADMGRDLLYVDLKGTIIGTRHPTVFDNDIVLLPFSYFSFVEGTRTIRSDQLNFIQGRGVVRSTDGGKTWEKVLGLTDSTSTSYSIFDPGFVHPGIPILINGQAAFGYFDEGSVPRSRDASVTIPVSRTTGRAYMLRAMPITTAAPFSGPKGRVTAVGVTSSADKGLTWTSPAKVSQTPTNILEGAQQTFSPSIAISNDGWVVFAYYDFRNWKGFPGELYNNIDPLTAPPLDTDAWLAVFRETTDPLGGSTGIGLDFVGEIRLTPESFNARNINMGTSVPYITPYVSGTPQGVGLSFNNHNDLFVLYGTQSPGDSNNITTEYKGMTVDTNGYYNLFLQRFKFPKPTNQ